MTVSYDDDFVSCSTKLHHICCTYLPPAYAEVAVLQLSGVDEVVEGGCRKSSFSVWGPVLGAHGGGGGGGHVGRI